MNIYFYLFACDEYDAKKKKISLTIVIGYRMQPVMYEMLNKWSEMWVCAKNIVVNVPLSSIIECLKI